MERYEPQNGFRVAPEVQQYMVITISGICPVFGVSPSMLLSTTQEQNFALGIHRLKADPTIKEVSPRTVPVWHQRQRDNNRKTAKPTKAVPTFCTLRIGLRARFKSSSPCSIIHDYTYSQVFSPQTSLTCPCSIPPHVRDSNHTHPSRGIQ